MRQNQLHKEQIIKYINQAIGTNNGDIMSYYMFKSDGAENPKNY